MKSCMCTVHLMTKCSRNQPLQAYGATPWQVQWGTPRNFPYNNEQSQPVTVWPSRPAPDSAAPFICSSCLCLIAILSIIYLRLHILSLCSFPLPTQRGVHTRHEGWIILWLLNGGSPCNDSTKGVKRATDARCIHNMITGTHWGGAAVPSSNICCTFTLKAFNWWSTSWSLFFSCLSASLALIKNASTKRSYLAFLTACAPLTSQ